MVTLPRTLFHGRMRTSTLVLSLLFLGVLATYLVVRPAPVASNPSGAVVPTRSTPTPTPSPSRTRTTVPTPGVTPSAPTPSASIGSGLTTPVPSSSSTPLRLPSFSPSASPTH